VEVLNFGAELEFFSRFFEFRFEFQVEIEAARGEKGKAIFDSLIRIPQISKLIKRSFIIIKVIEKHHFFIANTFHHLLSRDPTVPAIFHSPQFIR
jgi:hypothetical protein